MGKGKDKKKDKMFGRKKMNKKHSLDFADGIRL